MKSDLIIIYNLFHKSEHPLIASVDQLPKAYAALQKEQHKTEEYFRQRVEQLWLANMEKLCSK